MRLKISLSVLKMMGMMFALMSDSVSVITEVFAGLQFLVDIFVDDFLNRTLYAYDSLYVFLGKKALCPWSHTSGNDAINSLLGQKLRQEPGLVPRIGDFFPV